MPTTLGTRRRRITAIAAAGLVALGAAAAIVVAAAPASAATLCEQYATVVVGNYVVQNNRWGTSATQCINTTSSGFSITQQDGVGNLSGAPVSYPSIFLGCHYSNCSPNSPLPARVSTMGNANTSISLSYPGGGTWDAAYDIWLNADTNVSGVQDTEIMIWLNHQGSIQPIGSPTGSVTLAGRAWTVWTGSNGANNVVSYVANSAVSSLSFNARDFILDTFNRGSQYGNTNWYLTSMQAGFEPWIGGVGLAVTNFSASIGGGGTTDTQAPTTPGTPSASGITSSSINLSWSGSSDNVGVTGYDIYRAPGASGGTFASVGTSTGTSFTNSGLSASTTYRYQVRARDAAGNTSSFSSAVTATTSGGGGTDTQAPTTPGTPSASGITSSSINLSWSGSSDNVGVTGYDIYRAPGASGGTFASVGTSTGTSFTNSGLSANTTYRYQVRARDAAGNTSSFSSAVTATTTSGGGGTGGCSAAFRITNPWTGGFQAEVNVTNGSTASTSWTVTLAFPTSVTMTNLWNGVYTQSGNTVTVRNAPYNGSLGAGASTAFGFTANTSGSSGSTPSVTCTRA